jgi:cytochrome c oxidase subunit 2
MSHPQSYLSGSGLQTAWVTPLLWYSLVVSIAVVVIITGLVLWASVSREFGSGKRTLAEVPVERIRGGVRWIWIGLGISLVPLLVSLVWTVGVLARTGPVPGAPLTINVTARQWWWDAEYVGTEPWQRFRTANELHIPVGLPVRINLASGDVIHSFWVPKLSGKMDVIPGQTNITWIQAEKPGRYVGQCGEFCGLQHAHMRLAVIAEPPSQFARWREAQLRPARAPVTPEQARGLAIVEYRCSLCHAVRGTNAGAAAAPDLTHLMSRSTIAAGVLPNNPAALSGWIENPQSVKPGSLMPNQTLSGPDLDSLRAYLETLQ